MPEVIINIWTIICFFLNIFCEIAKFLFSPVVLPFTALSLIAMLAKRIMY